MEAMSYNLPIILFNYELWKYIYPKDIVTDDVNKSIKNVLSNYEFYSKLSNDFIKKYTGKIIIKQIFNFINTKNAIN
jgi:hypothetical protein